MFTACLSVFDSHCFLIEEQWFTGDIDDLREMTSQTIDSFVSYFGAGISFDIQIEEAS